VTQRNFQLLARLFCALVVGKIGADDEALRRWDFVLVQLIGRDTLVLHRHALIAIAIEEFGSRFRRLAVYGKGDFNPTGQNTPL
jgi:hypothetical protein